MKRKNNLLIVEDDWLNQKVYKAIFPDDYVIKICGDDKEFYAALEEKEYDLFIIDLALNSEESGIDLIISLRKMEKYKEIPIIVISAFTARKDKNIAMSAGATKFVNKPFDKNALLKDVQKYLC